MVGLDLKKEEKRESISPPSEIESPRIILVIKGGDVSKIESTDPNVKIDVLYDDIEPTTPKEKIYRNWLEEQMRNSDFITIFDEEKMD